VAAYRQPWSSGYAGSRCNAQLIEPSFWCVDSAPISAEVTGLAPQAKLLVYICGVPSGCIAIRILNGRFRSGIVPPSFLKT
jgi:hypothetical protein